jgi:hypothetical protein
LALLVGVSLGLVQASAQQERDSSNLASIASWPQMKPALGETAPDFVLKDLEGREFRLKDAVGSRPIVLEIGSYS